MRRIVPPAELAPEFVPLPRAPAVFGISRSSLYRMAGDGHIRFVKVGTSTLVDAASVRAFLAAQPAAVIRPELSKQQKKGA